MTKYFITGGTGIIGSEVVKILSAEKHNELFILTRKNIKYPNFDNLRVKYIMGDINDIQTYQDYLFSSEIIIHLAAEVHVGNTTKRKKKLLYDTNVEGTKTIIELFKKSFCKQFVYISTRQLFGKTTGESNENSPYRGIFQSYYVYTKYLAHELAVTAINEGYPVSIAILGTIYSPNCLDNGLGILFSRFFGRNKFKIGLNSFNSFLDSEDAAKGIIEITKNNKSIGQQFILTNGYLNYGEIYKLLSEVTDIRIPKFTIPIALGKIVAITITPILTLLGKDSIINKEIINNLNNSCKLSNKKSINYLSFTYKPLLPSIKEAITNQYKYFSFQKFD